MAKTASFLAIGVLGTFLAVPPILAQTGSLSASPNPCKIASGKSTCTTTLSWSSQNTSAVQVWVSHNGAAKTNFASSGPGSHTQDASWIQASPSHTYTFYLYNYSSGSRGNLLSSVTVTGKKSTPSPTATFSASPTTIEKGQSATVSWTTTNATSATINRGIGSVTPVAGGSRSVSPSSTTTYTLTVTGPGGTLTPKPTATVTVTDPPPAPSGTISASPNPCKIPAGKSTCTTTLSWSATGTSGLLVRVSRNGNASTVVSSSGVSGSTSPSWIKAAPANTYTFYLYDYAGRVQGSLLDSVTVTGKKSTPSPTATFSASPTTIEKGQSATLSWTTTNANGVSINQGVGTVTPIAGGSRSVSPSSTTTYTLTVTGPGGTLTPKPTATVTVTDPPPTISSFTASPVTVEQGKSSTLRWNTTHADTLSITPGKGTLTDTERRLYARTGLQVSPSSTTTYTLTATNPVKSVTATAKVTVTPPTPSGIISASLNPCAIAEGQNTCTSTISWTVKNTTLVKVYVSTNGATETLFAKATGDGSRDAPWIKDSANTHVFSLYDYTGEVRGSLLDSVSVSGRRVPTVSFFTASPETIDEGKSSTLSWSTANADTLFISPGVGTVTGTSVSVSPSSTTTYTLNASNAVKSVKVTATVTVRKTSPPTISSFTASPETIEQGESSTLRWSTTHADTLSITPGKGTLTDTERRLYARTGLQVSPSSTTTYTLTATNPVKSVTATAKVTVTDPPPEPPAPSGTISASPNPCTVYHSQTSCTVTVTWFSQNVSLVRVYRSVNGGIATKFAQSVGGGGSQNPQSMEATIEPGNRYTFSLYDYSNESLGETAVAVTEVTSQSNIQCP